MKENTGEAMKTTAPTRTDRSRPELARAVSVLRDRALAHCESSSVANEVLATAYRRRAAELDLAAWIGEHMVKDHAEMRLASK